MEKTILWMDYASTHVLPSRRRTSGRRGLTIESPEIRSDAFRRIFGGSTLSLNVTGDITIDGGMRHEKRSQVKTATNRAPNTNFQMKQTQRFKVEGKIGENVSVFVDQDSERPFEFNNAIKLQYTSDEDGIIKKIEAGNVALSLPSTRFVTFSAQNAGLFGIKSEIKVGKLELTGIASMEKGEKKKLSLSGGAQEETSQIHDYEYKRGTYFFLDYAYREQFNDNYNPETRIIGYEEPVITEIEIYKSERFYQNKVGEGALRAWAVIDPVHADTSFVDDENYRGYFLRLEPNTDYFVHKELGFILMNMPLSTGQVLAVAYRDASGGEYGQLLAGRTDTTATYIFKIIKPETPQPHHDTWNLEWKNVYSLGSRNLDPEGLEIKLFYRPASGNPEESIVVNGSPTGFLNLFGLDITDITGSPNPDNVIDNDNNILNLARGELIFPNLRPFDPPSDAAYPYPGEMSTNKYRTSAIYDTTDDAYIRKESKFYIEINSARRSANYSLGMNVIEGTEEVLLNGVKLQKDKDYTIDYFSGQLSILNEEALNPNANLEINYEGQQLFAMDKKALMGARAEYTLWEEGSNRSFIGATLLYLNQRTLDQRIRVGREAPMRNLVWDVNTSLKFEPAFLTKALDALPMLSATAPSSVAFEGELAQVIPNPNTLNNPSTGDNDGVAYLDDFEGAKRQISLGVIRSAWSLASQPLGTDGTAAQLSDRGHLIWYNPFEQVHINDIWPEREVTTNFGGTTRIHVLTMSFTPNDTLTDPTRSWGGIQRALSAGFYDQKDSRFLEVWVKGTKGRLHIDLGRISENVIPNSGLDTEDKRIGGIRNQILDEDEDTGLDGMFGDDPESPFLQYDGEVRLVMENGLPYGRPYDFWDVDRDSVKDPDEPWSFDNWQYTTGSTDYRFINGTENNRLSDIAIYPDTEDLNGNGDIDPTNQYFEISFSLDPTSADTAYIAGGKGNERGWLLYRIPLNAPEPTIRKINEADWTRIEYARVWVDGIEEETSLSIAEINLSGNEWKLRGVIAADSTYNAADDSTMTIAVVNTHDNPEYTSPPGVEGVIDPIQKIRSKEQSLVMKLDRLNVGETAIAEKQFFQPENLIHYKTLRMFVHGGDEFSNFPDDGSVDFFLRWGSDTNNEHYYEVLLPVFPGWDDRNEILVNFEDLSRLKLEMQTTLKDTISEVQENGHTLIIVGSPSLTNTRWLMIGVKNNGGSMLEGELWIDELRISQVRKDRGVAMRARADIKLSDFISITGEFNKKSADFHTVNERFGGGSHSASGNMTGSIQLHKLLPAGWGFAIPVSANYSRSEQTPKYMPGSDILVNENTTPDSILTEIQTQNKTMGFNVSLSKRTKSRNFWIRYLVDPIRTSFNYTKSEMSSSQIRFSKNLGLKGAFNYDLNFGNQYYVEPFKWLGTTGLLKSIATGRFYYLPKRISYSMNGTETNKDSETRGGVPSEVVTSNFSRNFNVDLSPFSILTFNVTKTLSSDMRYSRWMNIFSKLNPGDPLSRTQQLSANFNPKIFDWLSPSMKYSANYQWSDNPQMRTSGTSRSARINTNLTLSGNFNPQKFVQAFRKKPAATARPATRTPVRRRRPTQDAEEKKEEKKEEEEKKKPFQVLKVFTLLGNLIQKIDPISISVTETKSANHYGILGDPAFAYQIGFSLDPDVDISENVTQRSTAKEDYRISLRSGFKITNQLTTKLNYDMSTSDNRSTQRSGNVTQSALIVKGKAIPFPTWTVQWRGLEKLPLLSKITKTVSLSHGFNGKLTETLNDEEKTQETLSKDFRPLVSASFTFKNNMTANIQYATSETIQKQMKFSQGVTKRITSNLTISAKYQKRGGIKLPFIKKKLDNNIDFSLTFNHSVNATLQKQGEEGTFTETAYTRNWSFQPRITYSFTRTVNGGMNLELGERKDLRAGNTKITGFGINVKISLAG